MTGLLLLLGRCDWTTEPAEEKDLVVEAFLETERPLPPVTLRQTRPLSSPADSLRDAASGGQVRLALDGRTIPYEEGDQSGRYVPLDEELVPAGTPWQLRAEWQDDTARAQGVAPPPIEVAEVCVDVPPEPVRAVQVDSLRRDSLDVPADEEYIYPVEVAVQWPPPPSGPLPDSTYWVRVQLRPDAADFSSQVVEFFLEPAEVKPEEQFARREGTPRWQGVYAVPVDSSIDPLPSHELTTALVRGDTAFAAFAQTRTDPDRREPISNVDGALGIALGVAVDSLMHTVEPNVQRCRTGS